MSKKVPIISKDNIEHKLIEQQIKGVVIQQDTNFQIINDRLTEILDEQRKTNGRITKLEDNWISKEEFQGLKNETKLVRFLQGNKILFFIILYGLYNLFQIFDLEKIIKLIF